MDADHIQYLLTYELNFSKQFRITSNFYLNDTGYLSISDPKRLKETNKCFSKKVILVDRDGVLNIKNDKHNTKRILRATIRKPILQ